MLHDRLGSAKPQLEQQDRPVERDAQGDSEPADQRKALLQEDARFLSRRRTRRIACPRRYLAVAHRPRSIQRTRVELDDLLW